MRDFIPLSYFLGAIGTVAGLFILSENFKEAQRCTRLANKVRRHMNRLEGSERFLKIQGHYVSLVDAEGRSWKTIACSFIPFKGYLLAVNRRIKLLEAVDALVDNGYGGEENELRQALNEVENQFT